MNEFHGLLVLDKPGGITSRTAIDRAQRWFPRGTKIGHTGTLDPLATGVLVVCVGSTTRLTEYVQRMSKTYRATIRLGATSDTDDADGTITATSSATVPSADVIDSTLAQFIGEISQTPPAFSAAKVAGKRSYDLARQGRAVELAPRLVRIDAISTIDYCYPLLKVEVICGKGTYIRSLARDLGNRLRVGALVEALRRTRVGVFTVEQARELDSEPATARQALLPARLAVAELPCLSLGERQLGLLRQGQAIAWPEGTDPTNEAAVLDEVGRLAAIVTWESGAKSMRPEKVFDFLGRRPD